MLDIRSEGIRELADSLAALSVEPEVHRVMVDMGPKIARMMQRAIAPHRYTGELESTIKWSYNPARRELRIGSDHRRGSKFNALALLNYRTGPIPGLPFAPIAKWAAFKGLPAGPVWMSIKNKGVAPHPIMDKLEAQPEFAEVLNEGAKKLATDLLVEGFGVKRKISG